jgi:hypothetical protein
MAEGDRLSYRHQQVALAKEREIMKDVEGWEVCPAAIFVFSVDPSFAHSVFCPRHY